MHWNNPTEIVVAVITNIAEIDYSSISSIRQEGPEIVVYEEKVTLETI